MADDGEDVRVAENKESSLGPFADSQGLTHDDLSNPVPGKLTTIKVGIVLEIYDNIPGSNAKDTAALLLRLSHPDSSIHESNPESLRQKIVLNVKHRTKLKRNKRAALPIFLDKEFLPPVTPLPPPTLPVKRSYEELEADNKRMTEELKQMDDEEQRMQESNETTEKPTSNTQPISSPLTCYAIRLHPGEEIKSALQSFVEANNLQAAFILSCVGSVRKATLRLADSHSILEVNKNHEIVSLVGTLSNGGHLHASLSDEEGKVIGGHVMGNMNVFTTAEIVIGNMPSVRFSREMDNDTSYKELQVSQND